MATTPWDIGDQFTKMLYEERMKREGWDVEAQNKIAAAEIARSNADTLFQRNLYRDEQKQNFLEGQKALDRQQRHEENYLTNVVYKSGKLGRRGHVGGGGTTGATSSNTPTGSINAGVMSPTGAMQYYVSKGVRPIVAARVVGNISAESGWDPSVWSGTRRGDKGTAAYAGQWRGSRQENLVRYAQSQGHAYPTPADQLDFYFKEAEMGTDEGARTAMVIASQSKTPEDAAMAYMQHYERPADMSSAGHRSNAARQAYDAYMTTGSTTPDTDGGAAAGPPSSAPPSSMTSPVSTQRRYMPQGTGVPSAEELIQEYNDAGGDSED